MILTHSIFNIYYPLFIIFLLAVIVITGCYYWISKSASGCLYDDATVIPFNETALVLGTARLAPKGGLNRYYHYRILAAAALYKAGKAHYFIVSGGKSRHGATSEAADMKTSLMHYGIPGGQILTDEQGFRTWLSVKRCQQVFGCNKVTLISQRFHNERAVFIGRKRGMQVVALNAADVTGPVAGKMLVRETLARVKCVGEWLLWYIPHSLFKKF